MTSSHGSTRSWTSGKATSARMCTASGSAALRLTPRPRPIAWMSSSSQIAARSSSPWGSSCGGYPHRAAGAVSHADRRRSRRVAAGDCAAEEGAGQRHEIAVLRQRPPDDHQRRDVAVAVEAGDGVEVRDLDVGDVGERRLDALVGDDEQPTRSARSEPASARSRRTRPAGSDGAVAPRASPPGWDRASSCRSEPVTSVTAMNGAAASISLTCRRGSTVRASSGRSVASRCSTGLPCRVMWTDFTPRTSRLSPGSTRSRPSRPVLSCSANAFQTATRASGSPRCAWRWRARSDAGLPACPERGQGREWPASRAPKRVCSPPRRGRQARSARSVSSPTPLAPTARVTFADRSRRSAASAVARSWPRRLRDERALGDPGVQSQAIRASARRQQPSSIEDDADARGVDGKAGEERIVGRRRPHRPPGPPRGSAA